MDKNLEKNEEEKNELQSRRQFFKSVAKKALPLLGGSILVNAFTEKAHAGCNDCQNCCGFDCTFSCAGRCNGRCGGNCQGTCTWSCTRQLR